VNKQGLNIKGTSNEHQMSNEQALKKQEQAFKTLSIKKT